MYAPDGDVVSTWGQGCEGSPELVPAELQQNVFASNFIIGGSTKAKNWMDLAIKIINTSATLFK